MRDLRGRMTLLLLTVAGCGVPGGEASNPTLDVSLEEINVVPGEARFYSVRDVVLSTGTVWVLSEAPPFLTRVTLDSGEYLEFGLEGEGPSELRNPWAVQPISAPEGTRIRVWDLGNGRVSTYRADGAFVGSEPLSARGMVRARGDIGEVSYADPFRIRSGPEGVVLARFPGRVNRTGDIATGSLWRADSRLEPTWELARFQDHVDSGGEGLKEWAGVPLWDACEGSVALWSPDSTRVLWLDSQGRTTRTAPVEVNPTPLSLEDIEAYLRQMSRLELGPDHEGAGIDVKAMARSVQGQFAGERPFATDLRCQGGRVAWLRMFDTSVDPLGWGRSWLRVSADAPVREVAFPVGFSPVLFLPDRVFGFLEAPNGFQRLAWWSEVPVG